MNTTLKTLAIRTLTVSALLAATLTSAQAGVFIRTGVFVAPVYAAPVAVVAPMVLAPVAVYVPTCRFFTVPVMNAWTGITYMVTRRVCN